jgi:hypothetical protein
MLGARRRMPEPPFPASPLIRLRGAGITESSGAVASWDDIGSAALRFEAPTAPERPALVNVGSLTGAQCSSSGLYLRSTAAILIPEPYVLWCMFRMDTWAASDRIYDIDTNAFLATAAAGNLLRYEHGATDLDTVTPMVNGGIYQVCVAVAATSGTSRIYMDGVEEDSTAGTAATPASRAIGIGATNAGVAASSQTFLEAGAWSFASNAAMDAWLASDLPLLTTYGEYQITRAGG